VAYTALHISDLHRSPDDPIGNDELLSTLIADRDRYTKEDPAIPSPDAIIVSGDIVQGVSVGASDPDASLREQYAVATDFLSRLATRFVDGDRTRVVIVPGNHDVAWYKARAAMEAVSPSDLPNNLTLKTFGPTTDLRWDWREQRAYRIADKTLYDQRLLFYRLFLADFYSGLPFAFSHDYDSYYQLFELASGRIGVAAFNSCHGNDCFSFHGAIPETALANAHLELWDKARGYDLLMAVWHHNVEGAPYRSDYMDIDTVYRMIGKGFRLGLHGHQHRSEVNHRYVHLPEQEPMAIASAGSLCAGARELPTGVNRQYNIVELNDSLTSARVHVREMAIATVFAPAQRAEFGGKSFVELRWANKPNLLARGQRYNAVVFDAERAVAENRFQDAVQWLVPLDPAPGSYPRGLLVRALQQGRLWDVAVTTFPQPTDLNELHLLVVANCELHRFDDANTTLELFSAALNLQPPNRQELQRLIAARRAMAHD